MSAQEQSEYVTRPERARKSNERIAEKADRFRFVSRVPMLCECSDPNCEQIFLIELDRYREIQHAGYLTLPEHAVTGAEPRLLENGYWQHG
jgi:hypothetical protein